MIMSDLSGHFCRKIAYLFATFKDVYVHPYLAGHWEKSAKIGQNQA